MRRAVLRAVSIPAAWADASLRATGTNAPSMTTPRRVSSCVSVGASVGI